MPDTLLSTSYALMPLSNKVYMEILFLIPILYQKKLKNRKLKSHSPGHIEYGRAKSWTHAVCNQSLCF